MEIRKASLKDVEDLVLLASRLMLHQQSLAKNEPVRLEQYELVSNAMILWKKWVSKWIKSPKGLVLVAQEDGKLIGYSLNFIKENVKIYSVKQIGYMSDLYIEGNFRGKGIASKFKEMAFSWFKKKRMKYASIAFHTKNLHAHSVYEGWGFFDFHTEMRVKL